MTYLEEKDRLQQSQEADPWKKYAGTDYHQNAIDAAKSGDWEGATNWLGLREEKSAAQGNNRGKTSAQIYAELWDQYGTKPTTPSYDYDYDDRPTYSDNGMSARIDEMLNKVLNRDAFSYNAVDDPLYQQYKTQYQREGSRAMNDAMASAAATAGGMNSYAMTAAQQANNYYNAQLTDKIPELYQLAYEMYLKDIDQQVRDLGLLDDMDDKQYNRYRDTMSDWENDRNFAWTMYQDDVAQDQWQTTQNTNAMENAFDRATNMLQLGVMPGEELLAKAGISAEQAADYINNGYMTDQNTSAQSDAYNRAMDLLAAGAMPGDELLKKAGMTAAQASSILASVKAEQAAALGKYTGSSSGGSNGGSNGGGNGNGYTGDDTGDDTGDGNGYTGDTPIEDDNPDKEQGGNTTFANREEAIAYLNKKGIPNGEIAGMMTNSEWTRRKASLANYGTGGAEVSAYSTYAEYVNAYAQYLLEKNGK